MSEDSVVGFATSGTTLTGTAGGTISNCLTWPSYGYTTTVSSEPNYPIKIRAVSNGFILKNGCQEFVFQKPADLFKFLEKELANLKIGEK
jgi:hypothetical protein